MVLEVEGSAMVLEVERSALVLEDQKGLLLRLRKELGRALTRFASSTKFRRSLPSMKLAASACRIVRVIAARSKKQKTSTLSCAQLATRYCAATNSVMGMPHNDEEKMLLIETCIYVSDDTKDRLQKEWETEHMADGRPFPACAACGIRNPHHAKQYVYWKLSSLPQCFELSPADIERVESLGETEIFDFQTKPVVVDGLPSAMCSVFHSF